jgi:serine/threonine-protein kinase
MRFQASSRARAIFGRAVVYAYRYTMRRAHGRRCLPKYVCVGYRDSVVNPIVARARTTARPSSRETIVADPLLGQYLGRYELRALLGAGGMARVYAAFDHTLARDVAIKVLYPAGPQPGDLAERFRHEAHTLASLRHPYIVQIYDYGQHDALQFIVQQLQPGPTLEQELAALAAQGRQMERVAVHQLIGQLAEALDYAHGRNLIHRDLKPSNIIRNERGEIVVTDFGIAKALTSPLTHTQAGWVLGTPAYLSPEQARGSASLSPASDIYTLGVILFELLTGQVPFNDDRPMEVLLGHIQQAPPSPRLLRPDLPPTVEQVVFQALAKAPNARYATAGDLAQALMAAWQATALPSLHSQPTTLNRTPSGASRLAVFLGRGALQPARLPATTAAPLGLAPAHTAAIGSTISASAPPTALQRPARQRSYGAGITLLTLPALLILMAVLFFSGLPGELPLDTTPTTSVQSREPAGAVGDAAPPATATATLPPAATATRQPTATATLPPAATATRQPTATATPPAATATPPAATLEPVATSAPPPPAATSAPVATSAPPPPAATTTPEPAQPEPPPPAEPESPPAQPEPPPPAEPEAPPSASVPDF